MWPLLTLALLPAADPVPTYPDHANLMIVRQSDGSEQPIRTAADWSKRRAHILHHLQTVMGPLPGADRKVPLDPQVIEEKTFDTYIRRKVTIAVEKGDRLPMYLFVPKQPKRAKSPAMLCLHPTSKPLGKGVPAGLGEKYDRAYAVHLVERGYITLAPDYVNSGEYRFDPYANGYTSATMKGIWNHMRAVDYLLTLDAVDAERIGVIGHSLGGHNSMFVGVFDDRIRCIISNCGFCSFPKYMKGDLKGWSHDGYMPLIAREYGSDPKRMPFDFTEIVAALAPRPFFASAPIRDHNFDVEGVKDCVRAAQPVYDLLSASKNLRGYYPDADHNFPDEVRNTVYRWLDDVMK